MRLLRAVLLLTGAVVIAPAPRLQCQAAPAGRTMDPSTTLLVIRSDDAGMSHSVNMALQRLIESGLPVSVSVMFSTPWHQETIALLKRHPNVSVGVHLTLNSEWKDYRWGPVLGRSAVPTLVDSSGYFFASSEALYRNQPDLVQVEKELRAQIERALHSGLKIDYVDYHMGTAVGRPEFRDIAERLAREYALGMAEYFGETREDPQYAAAPRDKGDSLDVMLRRLRPGATLLVTHVGIDNDELGALVDMNTDGPLADMSKNRQGELTALLAPRFRAAVTARKVQLITYRQLIEMQGLKSMRRPGGR